ncbi:MAG: spore coat protein CotJB [Acutalibacteraceae bacterium]
MINQNNLKHRLMTLRFAIWDLHLYLDTHPEDEEKVCLLKSYKEKYISMLPEYENRYGALSSPMYGNNCEWISHPFPWIKGGD